jgi:hypothetical protein
MVELRRRADRATPEKPIKEVGVYIGIGTILVILVLLVILL